MEVAMSSFSEVALNFLAQRGATGSPATTLEAYGRCYRQFAAYLFNNKHPDSLRSFTPDTVQGWMTDLHGRGIKPRTITKSVSALAAFGKWATRQKPPLLRESPCVNVQWPRAQKVPPRFLLPHELKAFVAQPALPGVALARDIFLDTGLRVSELCHARVKDLMEGAHGMMLQVTVKGGQVRMVPLSPHIVKRIRASLKTRQATPEAPLVATSQDTPFTRQYMSDSIRLLARRAGITRVTISAHSLRHTVNVYSREGGNDLTTRQFQLGHSSPKTTGAYDHLIPGLSMFRARAKQVAAMQELMLNPGGASA
jgi:integrase/recombinase XerD